MYAPDEDDIEQDADDSGEDVSDQQPEQEHLQPAPGLAQRSATTPIIINK